MRDESRVKKTLFLAALGRLSKTRDECRGGVHQEAHSESNAPRDRRLVRDNSQVHQEAQSESNRQHHGRVQEEIVGRRRRDTRVCQRRDTIAESRRLASCLHFLTACIIQIGSNDGIIDVMTTINNCRRRDMIAESRRLTWLHLIIPCILLRQILPIKWIHSSFGVARNQNLSDHINSVIGIEAVEGTVNGRRETRVESRRLA
jgi:hypothetical protein